MGTIDNNVLKLEGYGVYVSVVDGKLYESPIDPRTNWPTLDKDKCIDWTETNDPPNQEFLNLINEHFGCEFTMIDFGKPMKISEIKALNRQKLLPAPYGLQDANKLISEARKKWKEDSTKY